MVLPSSSDSSAFAGAALALAGVTLAAAFFGGGASSSASSVDIYALDFNHMILNQKKAYIKSIF